MAYKGKYQPSHPRKYKGNPSNIIYRSLWERKFMVYCDLNENILEWGSEEIIIPYRSPVDGKVHRYFPDFYIKVRESTGYTKNILLRSNQRNKQHHPKNQNAKPLDIFVRRMSMLRTKQNGKQHQSGVRIGVTFSKYSLRKNSASNEQSQASRRQLKCR